VGHTGGLYKMGNQQEFRISGAVYRGGIQEGYTGRAEGVYMNGM
jgi:hypothetical protein